MGENEDAGQLDINEVTFAEQVKIERESIGWSQEDLAERMRQGGLPRVNQVTISRIENGLRSVRLIEAQVLASIFKSTITRMIYPGVPIVFFAYADAQAETARKRHDEFVVAAREMALAQAHYSRNLEAIRALADDGTDPRISLIVESYLDSIYRFIAIDAVAEVAEIFAKTPRD